MGVHTCHFFNRTKCSPSSFSFSSEFDPSQYASRFFFIFTQATFFWVRACFIWVRLQFYAIHVIFEAIQLPVDQYWNKLRVLGVAIWTDVWVSRGCFSPPPPSLSCCVSPCPLKGLRWVEKKTQSFGFNLILSLQWKTTCKQDVAVVEMLTCSRAFLAINFL